MLNLEIDIETFSSVNLAKAGVYRYAESPDFEVLLFGYSVDGGEVKVGDLVKGEKIPEEVMSALEDEAVTKWAFNAQFERICISRMLGYEAGTYLVPASWKCSMVWSAYMGLARRFVEEQLVARGMIADLAIHDPKKAKDKIPKDWNECLVAEVPVENMAKQMCWRDAREKPVPVMKMSEVEETVVQWLWYPFIPFGKVTLIQGNPGKGKTWLAMAIAAYCTNGKELPNALPIEPFNVLYQTAEDGIADTIKPRLAKCGADMTRVRFINEDEKQLSMTDDRIEKAIRQNSVRLMIMDPIQAYLGANVDMNRANEIRPLFRHLSTIAERTGCAIVLIGHLNKSSGSQSDYRSLGSIDIAAAVRSILFVEKVEKEKEQDIRVVYQQKDSLAKKENPVAFSLGEEGLKWLGEYDISIEDLLMGKAGTKKETKLEKAQKLILELLTKRKVMCLEELEAELLAYGISSRTGRDVRKQLENRLSYDWCQGRKTVALITE